MFDDCVLAQHTYKLNRKEAVVKTIFELEATVGSKGRITFPAALRAKFGLVEGSKIKFISDGKQIMLKPELPVSAYCGILRHLGNIDTTIPKEPDRF